jgi:hypothetical protein
VLWFPVQVELKRTADGMSRGMEIAHHNRLNSIPSPRGHRDAVRVPDASNKEDDPMYGRKGWILLATGLLLAASVITSGRAEVSPAGEKSNEKPPPLMEQKLGAMNGVLEGIAKRDFRKIRESGDLLQRISVIDQWLKYPDMEYGQMTEDFRRGVENMIMAADVDNLEGATLYYQKVTTSCLECHTFMRDPRHL